jgi:hypothetical protein
MYRLISHLFNGGSFNTLPAKLAVTSDADNLTVYPNPGSGIFTVSSAQPLQTIKLF